ncbi:hypothetical protein WAC87_003610 [Shigella flexneri]|uniref:hypothetical protein n=1 Tax=Escherichia sp. MOD1-EC7003 TaxID=2093900 RepID=UPI001F53EC22|nr:hypothetical protein [Escherichia sp. MOD1-EC7003]
MARIYQLAIDHGNGPQDVLVGGNAISGICIGCAADAAYPTYKDHCSRRPDKAFTPHPARSKYLIN